MALVYRVELDNGRGPYISEWADGETVETLREELCKAHGTDEEHPGPRRDGLTPYGRIFGFSNRKQLREWFAGWSDDLAEAGFRVNVYRIHKDAVQHGNRQCVFYGASATLIKSLNPRQVLDTAAQGV